jgi:hypothetical protein
MREIGFVFCSKEDLTALAEGRGEAEPVLRSAAAIRREEIPDERVTALQGR